MIKTQNMLVIIFMVYLLLNLNKGSQYFLIESFTYDDSVIYCEIFGGKLVHFSPNEYAVCCRGCNDIDCNNGCYEDDIILFEHKSSKNMADIEEFINEMSPSSVTRIFGGISYPDLHVWVAHDNSGKQYKFHLTDPNIFVGNNNNIDVSDDKVMIIGYKPTPGPYCYWVEEITNPSGKESCIQQSTLFQHKWSQNMNEIEIFINQMSPSSVTRIFGAVSYPDLHVWVANDNSGKQYKFELSNWSTFVGSNNDINIVNDKVMIFDFKPTPEPYCYLVQEV